MIMDTLINTLQIPVLQIETLPMHVDVQRQMGSLAVAQAMTA